MSVHDAATSVRLELREVYEAPENKTCKNRHVYGVGEKVEFKTVPADSSIMFRATKGDLGDLDEDSTTYETFEGVHEVDASVSRIYTCPISAGYVANVAVSLADVV